jgi:hypothetical protein
MDRHAINNFIRRRDFISSPSLCVIAGLVPAIPLRRARRLPKRDARVEPAHDELIGFGFN